MECKVVFFLHFYRIEYLLLKSTKYVLDCTGWRCLFTAYLFQAIMLLNSSIDVIEDLCEKSPNRFSQGLSVKATFKSRYLLFSNAIIVNQPYLYSSTQEKEYITPNILHFD